MKLFEDGMNMSIAIKNFINFGENRKDLWESKYVFKYKNVVDYKTLTKKLSND